MTDEELRQLIACHECDLLLEKTPVPDGYKAKCPRCGHVLYQPKSNSVEKSMALAIAGLMLFAPANFLPLLTMSVLGQSREDTMISGIVALYDGGLWWVSFLVLLCSVIVPLLKLLLMLYVTVCLSTDYRPDHLAAAFLGYHKLNTWGMLEVYMLGILVSMVKLMDLAEVVPGLGLYSFIGLLLVTVMLSAAMDEAQFWEQIEGRSNAR